jgi:hypothetical protein
MESDETEPGPELAPEPAPEPAGPDADAERWTVKVKRIMSEFEATGAPLGSAPGRLASAAICVILGWSVGTVKGKPPAHKLTRGQWIKKLTKNKYGSTDVPGKITTRVSES